VGFELPVRSEKFAFEFSAEFPASLDKFGFRENFAPEVLDVSIRFVPAVRSQVASRHTSLSLLIHFSDTEMARSKARFRAPFARRRELSPPQYFPTSS
jgi:hypothetical protein